MNQLSNIINYVFKSCFNNNNKKYNINKYKNYKFRPKLDIIYE